MSGHAISDTARGIVVARKRMDARGLGTAVCPSAERELVRLVDAVDAASDAATYVSFRAWHNMLRIPHSLDQDVLLAAGVIVDDEDWRLWNERGWLFFMLRPAVTDEQELALFKLVREALPLPDVHSLIRQADLLLHERTDQHGEWAHTLLHQAAAHLSDAPEIRAQVAVETPRMLAAARAAT